MITLGKAQSEMNDDEILVQKYDKANIQVNDKINQPVMKTQRVQKKLTHIPNLNDKINKDISEVTDALMFPQAIKVKKGQRY